jgi:hypothetical protein
MLSAVTRESRTRLKCILNEMWVFQAEIKLQKTWISVESENASVSANSFPKLCVKYRRLALSWWPVTVWRVKIVPYIFPQGLPDILYLSKCTNRTNYKFWLLGLVMDISHVFLYFYFYKYTGCLKRALQWYSKCYCVASVTMLNNV